MSLKVGDITIIHPVDMCNSMADHFTNVFSDTTDAHSKNNDNFKTRLEEKVLAFKVNALKSKHQFIISPNLISKICHKLPYNNLFNYLINTGYVPNEWHRDVLICIYKGHNKSKLNPDLYRGIISRISEQFKKPLIQYGMLVCYINC